MAIRVPTGSETGWRLDVLKGVEFFADANCTQRLGAFESDKKGDDALVYAGAPIGESVPARAVVHTTGTPYDDGNRYPTIVYVRDDKVGDPFRIEVPSAEPQPYEVIVGGKPVGSVTLP